MKGRYVMTKKTKVLLACLVMFFTIIAVVVIWFHTNPTGQQVYDWLFPVGVAR